MNTYPNRYEALGRAAEEVATSGGGIVYLHADDCRAKRPRRNCKCRPKAIFVVPS